MFFRCLQTLMSPLVKLMRKRLAHGPRYTTSVKRDIKTPHNNNPSFRATQSQVQTVNCEQWKAVYTGNKTCQWSDCCCLQTFTTKGTLLYSKLILLSYISELMTHNLMYTSYMWLLCGYNCPMKQFLDFRGFHIWLDLHLVGSEDTKRLSWAHTVT